ncbi:MAG: SMC-Scp complex subunit ScpB [Ignavibacteriae bacterium]|nr:SMC-Scp complex subunit ScpB [Ignavibacteriota bacterium]
MSSDAPTPPVSRQILDILEALIFASDEPLSLRQLQDLLDYLGEAERPKSLNQDVIQSAIEFLNREYDAQGRSFRISRIAGGFQFSTKPEFGIWLGRLVRERSKRKLSVSALESLAVIAYKQPVTKPELEAIRGVNADYVLRTLMERNLVTIVGRAATPGRPLLYGTTREFLKHFGLNDLSDLPKPREIDELMAEAEYEVEKRMLKELEEKREAEEGKNDDPDLQLVSGEE